MLQSRVTSRMATLLNKLGYDKPTTAAILYPIFSNGTDIVIKEQYYDIKRCERMKMTLLPTNDEALEWFEEKYDIAIDVFSNLVRPGYRELGELLEGLDYCRIEVYSIADKNHPEVILIASARGRYKYSAKHRVLNKLINLALKGELKLKTKQ